MKLTIREYDGVGPYKSQDPVVFVGNWTGLECGGRYVVHVRSFEDVRAFEGTAERRGKELQKVPVDGRGDTTSLPT